MLLFWQKYSEILVKIRRMEKFCYISWKIIRKIPEKCNRRNKLDQYLKNFEEIMEKLWKTFKEIGKKFWRWKSF